MLQENGVQTLVVDRVDALLMQMDDLAATELGPEARWGLARLVRRADEGMVALQCILDVLLRRLRPRGTWPVVRTPYREIDQLRHFHRARNYGSIFEETLTHHLNVPLQPREDGPNMEPDTVGVDAGPPVEEDEADMGAASSSSSSQQAADRERSRSRSVRRTADADAAAGVDRPEQHGGQQPGVHTVFPPSMQRALDGELMGVWREPEELSASTSTTSSCWTTSSTSTSWTWASTSPTSSCWPTSLVDFHYTDDNWDGFVYLFHLDDLLHHYVVVSCDTGNTMDTLVEFQLGDDDGHELDRLEHLGAADHLDFHDKSDVKLYLVDSSFIGDKWGDLVELFLLDDLLHPFFLYPFFVDSHCTGGNHSHYAGGNLGALVDLYRGTNKRG